MPNSNIVFGIYLVDLYCLGLKDTFCNIDVSVFVYETEIKRRMFFDEPSIFCDVDMAHSIIYGGIEYAEALGFSPQRDFRFSRQVLEPPKQITIDTKIVFGYQGKPFYIKGPYDDAARIICKLQQAVGEGNFYVLDEEAGEMMETVAEMENAGLIAKKKIGRNQPCPCGSGKKHKKCCIVF